jgi:predicted amidohydrolase YtcJ
VLDRDIMTIPERDILGTTVLATYIGGRAVYERAR